MTIRPRPVLALAAIYAVLTGLILCVPCSGGEVARVRPSGGEVVVERLDDGTVRVLVPTAHGRVVVEVAPPVAGPAPDQPPTSPAPQDPTPGGRAVEILGSIEGLARVDVARMMAAKARDAAMLLRQGRIEPHEAPFYWQSESEAALGPRYRDFLPQIRSVVALVPGDRPAEESATLLGQISLALDGVQP